MLTEPSTSTPDPTPAFTPQQTPVESPESKHAPESPEAAAKSGDARAFKEARHQERVDKLQGKQTVAVRENKPGDKIERPVDPQTQPKKKSLEGRKQVVDAEVEDLKRQLSVRDELRRQLAATDPKPKPAETVKPETKAKPAWADDPAAPKLDQFASYEEYLDARADFIADKKLEKALSERDQQSSRQSEAIRKIDTVKQQGETFKTRVADYQKANPSAQFHPTLLEIMPMSAIEAHNALAPADQQLPIGAEHFIIEQVFNSELSGPMLAHFTSNPDDFQRLYTLANQNPAAAIKQIGMLEAQLGKTPASPAPSPSARVSNLPNPPTVLNGKAAALDPIRSAVKSGDVRAFKQLRHQERVARLGSR